MLSLLLGNTVVKWVVSIVATIAVIALLCGAGYIGFRIWKAKYTAQVKEEARIEFNQQQDKAAAEMKQKYDAVIDQLKQEQDEEIEALEEQRKEAEIENQQLTDQLKDYSGYNNKSSEVLQKAIDELRNGE